MEVPIACEYIYYNDNSIGHRWRGHSAELHFTYVQTVPSGSKFRSEKGIKYEFVLTERRLKMLHEEITRMEWSYEMYPGGTLKRNVIIN